MLTLSALDTHPPTCRPRVGYVTAWATFEPGGMVRVQVLDGEAGEPDLIGLTLARMGRPGLSRGTRQVEKGGPLLAQLQRAGMLDVESMTCAHCSRKLTSWLVLEARNRGALGVGARPTLIW